MFRDLIPLLGTDFRSSHRICRDPGDQQCRNRRAFTYTFEKLAEVISGFTEAVGPQAVSPSMYLTMAHPL